MNRMAAVTQLDVYTAAACSGVAANCSQRGLDAVSVD